jgi:hypothetical protein
MRCFQAATACRGNQHCCAAGLTVQLWLGLNADVEQQQLFILSACPLQAASSGNAVAGTESATRFKCVYEGCLFEMPS